MPIVTLAIAGATVGGALSGADVWIDFAARQIGFGLLIGVGVAAAAAVLISRASALHWSEHSYERIAMLAVALLAFAAAEVAEGNGFIAAFVAGLIAGNFTRSHCEGLLDFSEAEGELLTLLTFFLFGGAFVGAAIDDLTWRAVVYALLSLTLVRMLPVALAMTRAELRWESLLFLGWFGPRGLASIVFGLMVLEAADVPAQEEVFTVVVWTVLFSVFAHGISAPLAVVHYTRRVLREEAIGQDGEAEMPMEMMPMEEMPTRWSGAGAPEA